MDYEKTKLPRWKNYVMFPKWWSTEGYTPLPYQNIKNKNGTYYKEYNSDNWL